jgi:hypothetical protein
MYPLSLARMGARVRESLLPLSRGIRTRRTGVRGAGALLLPDSHSGVLLLLADLPPRSDSTRPLKCCCFCCRHMRAHMAQMQPLAQARRKNQVAAPDAWALFRWCCVDSRKDREHPERNEQKRGHVWSARDVYALSRDSASSRIISYALSRLEVRCACALKSDRTGTNDFSKTPT